MQPDEIAEVLDRPHSRELLARHQARLAYVARDGTPRVIPIAFTWDGAAIVMHTSKNAPKLRALRERQAVALTIDTEGSPPTILLIRGRANWPPSRVSRTTISGRPTSTRRTPRGGPRGRRRCARSTATAWSGSS